MALIICRDCKKQISDEAKSCPNCGYPIRFNNQKIWFQATLAIVIIAIGIHLVLNGASMPGGLAIFFGLFMIVFGSLVIVAML